MTTAKQRAWRIKFGRIWGGKKPKVKHHKYRVKVGRYTIRGDVMSRKKKYGRSRSSRGNILMKGFFGSKIPFGLLGLVGAGYLYSKFVSPSVPKVIGMQSALTESAVIGGLPMAVGSFLAGSSSGLGGQSAF